MIFVFQGPCQSLTEKAPALHYLQETIVSSRSRTELKKVAKPTPLTPFRFTISPPSKLKPKYEIPKTVFNVDVLHNPLPAKRISDLGGVCQIPPLLLLSS